MTGSFLFILFMSSAFITHGQSYGNIWHFGNETGLDFNSCEPVVVHGSNIGFEGCATVCNDDGELLFYTNSDNVWNRFHQVMPDGQLVNSGGSLSQVLIVRQPDSDDLYYIITTDMQAGGDILLQYHIVDMSLDNGYGNVSSANSVLSESIITEQVAATYHSNGTDVWILVHEYATNNFLCYLLTGNGISSTPVISATGPVHETAVSNMNARGQIKFSPDGSLLAFNGNGTGENPTSDILALFEYDNTSGIVSNPVNLPTSRGEFALSFSPDSKKLYGSTWKAFNFGVGSLNYIYQFNLESADAQTIIESKIILDSTTSTFGDMKLAPDGKIYISHQAMNYLSVISQPDSPGLECGYLHNGFSLGEFEGSYGLNNYIEYTSYCNQPVHSNDNASHHVSVYPNPSSATFTIEVNSSMINASIELVNCVGHTVSTISNVNGYSYLLDIRLIPVGEYLILVKSAENDLVLQRCVMIVP